MNLKNYIRKILNEEKENKLNNLIANLVDTLLQQKDPSKKLVCGYEIFTPTFQGRTKYRMVVRFNNGPNGSLWPRTKQSYLTEESILDEIQKEIESTLGINFVMYSQTGHCG